jgi:protein tyrosine/serine phosphatase
MSPSRRIRTLTQGFALALLLVFGAEAARTVFGSNFHPVVRGRCYRSSQPSPTRLRLLERTFHIRSIINLRGVEDDRVWYKRERSISRELNMQMLDRGMWAQRPPTEEEFHDIVRAVDGAEEPILIHCVSGIDRSGIVSAIFMLLRTDATVEEAWRQLGVRYGHNPWGKAACQDRVLAAYIAWLAARGLVHRPEHFRRWALEDYRQEPSIEWSGLE